MPISDCIRKNCVFNIDGECMSVAHWNKCDYYKPGVITTSRKIDADKLASKIAGHSYYHGDRILSAIFCMAEGKEIGNIKPTNVYDKDSDMGKLSFSQRLRLEKEYDKWIEENNKKLSEAGRDVRLYKNCFAIMLLFLEEKGFRRVFYD